MKPVPVTVVILTKNEERALPSCLDSVSDFDEVFVVDSNSDDATAAIAASRSVKVIEFDWDGGYPKKKQWALENVPARNEWVLLLDADEQPTSGLVSEIRRFMASADRTTVGALDIPLLYEWQGRKLRWGHRVVKRSLLHRARCAFPVVDDLDVATMGEVEGHYQPQTTFPVRRAKARLLHRDPDPVAQWFARHNRYSDWEAHLRVSHVASSVAEARSRQGRAFSRVPGKPLVFFLYSYFLRAGFLDGQAGFDYALAQSFYYWQIDIKVREATRAQGS